MSGRPVGPRPAARHPRNWTATQRWCAKVVLPENPDGCWGWNAAQESNGYSVFMLHPGKQVKAHRWGYEKFVGPVPAGMQLDHFKCDHQWCVNPMHVRPASARENVLRSSAPSAAMAAQTHCKRGHLLAGENLRSDPSGRHRMCRTCWNEAERGRRKVRREKRKAVLA